MISIIRTFSEHYPLNPSYHHPLHLLPLLPDSISPYQKQEHTSSWEIIYSVARSCNGSFAFLPFQYVKFGKLLGPGQTAANFRCLTKKEKRPEFESRSHYTCGENENSNFIRASSGNLHERHQIPSPWGSPTPSVQSLQPSLRVLLLSVANQLLDIEMKKWRFSIKLLTTVWSGKAWSVLAFFWSVNSRFCRSGGKLLWRFGL